MSCDVSSPPNPTRSLTRGDLFFLFGQTHFGSNKHKCLFNSLHVFVRLHRRFLPIRHVEILNSFAWTISIQSKFVFIRLCWMFLMTHDRFNSFNQTIFTPNNPLYDHKWVIIFATSVEITHMTPIRKSLSSAHATVTSYTRWAHFQAIKIFPPPLSAAWNASFSPIPYLILILVGILCILLFP